MSQLIDEILAGLATTRQSMQRQVGKIGDIMDKSNNTLLHIESQNNMQTHTTISSPPPTTNSIGLPQNVYNLKPNCEVALVKILEHFQQLMQQSANEDNTNAVGYSALDGCLAYRQRVEYLGSSVRKLVALCDTVTQMKQNMQEQEQQPEEEQSDEEIEQADDEY